MNLQQLEYIQALDQFRHFGKAADYCRVTQPTLSTMIQKLEEELGVKIFDRSHQPIVPTAVGRRILDQARLILRQTEQMQELVSEEMESLRGEIRLGILPTIAPNLLPMMLPQLEKQLPEVRVTITELLTSQCEEALLSGHIDLAIYATNPTTPLLESTPLYYEEFMGYVPRGSELYATEHIRSADVGKHQLWLLDEGHCFRDQLVKFCHLKNAPGQRYHYSQGSMDTFMHFVEEGYGVTFVPELLVERLDDKRRDLVRPFALPRPTRRVALVRHREYVRHQLIDRLSSIVRQVVPEHMLELSPMQDLV